MLRSSCHCAIGNRCFADRALIVARTLGFEANAPSIAILNWLIKCLLVVDSIVYHHLEKNHVSVFLVRATTGDLSAERIGCSQCI